MEDAISPKGWHCVIASFEKDYWNTREKTLNRVSNYKKDYLEHFLYLPQDEVVTADLFKRALLNSSAPDTRKRKGRTIAWEFMKLYRVEED